MVAFIVKNTIEGKKGRTGMLKTPHGEIQTPAFIIVGTKATVKAVTPAQLQELECQVALSNTYHLYLRPGEKIVEQMGGLHTFMQWDGPTITDSGGFQVFSLGFAIEHGVGKVASETAEKTQKKPGKKLMNVDDEGVTFYSHIDGSEHRLTPESSIAIQEKIGADIILAFDECTSPLSTYEYTKQSMIRTHNWAQRCIKVHKTDQALFGIIQGGRWRDLREESAKAIASMGFDGYAIGGSFGKLEMYDVLDWVVPYLEDNKARHLLGIGEIDDIFESVERGADMFDCILPTRNGRLGQLYITPEAGGNKDGKWLMKITNSAYKEDSNPIDPSCDCYTCTHFTRAYLRHLFVSHELLAYTLATIHNLRFMMRLMKNIRESIDNGHFAALKKKWLD